MRKKKPYDRTGGTDPALPVGADQSALPPDAQAMAPQVAPPDQTGGGMDLSQLMQPQPGMGGGAPDIAGLLGGGGDQIGGDPMAALGGDAGLGQDQGFVEDDQTIQDMMDALNNPETPPELRDAINAQIALAARRRLAGAGGGLQ